MNILGSCDGRDPSRSASLLGGRQLWKEERRGKYSRGRGVVTYTFFFTKKAGARVLLFPYTDWIKGQEGEVAGEKRQEFRL